MQVPEREMGFAGRKHRISAKTWFTERNERFNGEIKVHKEKYSQKTGVHGGMQNGTGGGLREKPSGKRDSGEECRMAQSSTESSAEYIERNAEHHRALQRDTQNIL
ncbi:hypothetical protein XENTR_v10023735 [Xenopus tropicalis]|nr:hypothetical protein XENTR_v10023735 [Xenopus tropicalis]